MIGHVDLPDGRLTAWDPFMLVNEDPVRLLGRCVPPGRYPVEVDLRAGEAGDTRVDAAAVVCVEGDPEPHSWTHLATIAVDSGMACFAPPAAAERALTRGEDAVAELESALARGPAADTWQSATADGLVAFSTGFGDGTLDLWSAHDASGAVLRIVLDCLPEDQVRARVRRRGRRASPDRLTGSPGAGLQRAFLLPTCLGGVDEPLNAITIPPRVNRRLTVLERRAIRALIAGADLDLEVRPEYDDETIVPTRVHFTAEGSGLEIHETVEIR